MSTPAELPVAVLGASGYAAGELLRLLVVHPHLRLRVAVSHSRVGRPVAETFPHLRGAWGPYSNLASKEMIFGSEDDLDALLDESDSLAVFACLPHGESAARIDALLTTCETRGVRVHLVDLSADFRLPSPQEYERIYGTKHSAPGRYSAFTCGLPELTEETPRGPVANPGCFTTAVTLACAPAQAVGFAEPCFRVSAITGSTGSGRSPSATTHHPERHGNLKAYSPLVHRHTAEMNCLLARLNGNSPEVRFVPHSGPWSRGIHATVYLDLKREMTTDELVRRYAAFYARSPFVSVADEPPRLKDVVGTNRCHLGVVGEGRSAVVLSVIDNLTKGAAGGAVHWMNRLSGFAETAGLNLPGVGWN